MTVDYDIASLDKREGLKLLGYAEPLEEPRW